MPDAIRRFGNAPKYGSNIPPTPLGVAPDVFLMPTVLPTEDNPEPDPHDLNTTRLPAKILTAHGVDPKDFANHIWQVVMRLVKVEERVLRETKVYHMGKLVEQRMPRR